MDFNRIAGVFLILILSTLLYPEKLVGSEKTNSSNNITISLLTISEGAELYSTFGHSTFRVRNRLNGSDCIYNYGTFRFDTPNFYLKFIKGRLPYYLSKMEFANLIELTKKENRSITENIFLLTDTEEKDLINRLEFNYLPWNREYYYDFFKDNCSTRLFFLIDSATGGRFSQIQGTYHPLSYRELLKKYWKKRPWSGLGIEILLGAGADKKATSIQGAFLPENLQELLVESVDPQTKLPLVRKSEILLKRNAPVSKSIMIQPWYIFLLILILSLFFGLQREKYFTANRFFDVITIGSYSILGIMLFVLWGVSEHTTFRWNLSLAWANPVYLLFLISTIRKIKVIRYIALSILTFAIVLAINYSYKPEIVLLILILISRLLLASKKL